MISEIAAILGSIVAGATILKFLRGWRHKSKRGSRLWVLEEPAPMQRSQPRLWPPPGYTHVRQWGPNGFE